MDTASSGQVLVDGSDVAKYNSRQLTGYRRDDIGFVFQFYNLVQNLTALENVELALQICKEPLDAAQVLREVGLGERLNNFPAQLSGGEQQRVFHSKGFGKKSQSFFCVMSLPVRWITIRKIYSETFTGHLPENGDDCDCHYP